MFAESLEILNFRNYAGGKFLFDAHTNVLYGNNAQGKTNILEALQVCSTARSHRGSHDAEMIRFGEDEAHIRLFFQKKGRRHKIDVHLRKNGRKGVAVDGIPIRRAAELYGQMHLVSFFPEDLRIVKNGPRDRRRFLDGQLCQLNELYVARLTEYNRIVLQRNTLLKDARFDETIDPMLDVWDEQMTACGGYLIEQRGAFIEKLNTIVAAGHAELTGGREQLHLRYEPNTAKEDFAERLRKDRDRDRKWKVSSTGPHRDDIQILVNGVDIRHYGSQGQQRSAALSLKLAEIALVRELIGDTPVLLLDDVLSELDTERQKTLLKSIKETQTFLTCTGMDELVEHHFPVDRAFYIENGAVGSISDAQDAGRAETRPAEDRSGQENV